MKNIILVIGISIYSCTMYAQELEMKRDSKVEAHIKGAYYSFPELEKFTGTWVYLEGNTEFKIVIKNEKTFLPGSGLEFYRDYLQGYYCYGIDFCESEKEEYTITNGSTLNKERLAEFTFRDQIKDKSGTATLELLPGEENSAKWTVTNRETITINKGKSDYTFSVPTEVILTKVK